MFPILPALVLALLGGLPPEPVPPPIIDMHLHARRAGYLGPDPSSMCTPGRRRARVQHPTCAAPIPAATTDEQVMRDTLAVMEARNSIGMVSGEPDLLAVWTAEAPDRIIAGLDLRIEHGPTHAHVTPRSPQEVRALHVRGVFTALGEVMAQYEGIPADDPRLAPTGRSPKSSTSPSPSTSGRAAKRSDGCPPDTAAPAAPAPYCGCRRRSRGSRPAASSKRRADGKGPWI